MRVPSPENVWLLNLDMVYFAAHLRYSDVLILKLCFTRYKTVKMTVRVCCWNQNNWGPGKEQGRGLDCSPLPWHRTVPGRKDSITSGDRGPWIELTGGRVLSGMTYAHNVVVVMDRTVTHRARSRCTKCARTGRCKWWCSARWRLPLKCYTFVVPLFCSSGFDNLASFDIQHSQVLTLTRNSALPITKIYCCHRNKMRTH